MKCGSCAEVHEENLGTDFAPQSHICICENVPILFKHNDSTVAGSGWLQPDLAALLTQ